MVKKVVYLELDGSGMHKSRWNKNTHVIGFVKNTNNRLGQDFSLFLSNTIEFFVAVNY